MIVAMVGFTLNDAITKFSSESMNMAQVMLVRGAFASLFVGLLAWKRGALADPAAMLQPMVAMRVAGEAGATVSFLVALAHLPIGNVSAVMQALPLAVTMGAALVFGEGVGWRRWTAIAAGFVGVLIIVRRGSRGSAYIRWSHWPALPAARCATSPPSASPRRSRPCWCRRRPRLP